MPDGSDKDYSVHELLGLVQPKDRDELVRLGEKIGKQQEDRESTAEVFNRVVEPKITILGITFNINELFAVLLGRERKKGR